MRILLCVVSVLFGGLSMTVAFSQLKNEKKPIPAILMIAGSLLLLAAVIGNIAGLGMDYMIALPGCAAICAAAIWNGIRGGPLHIRHHIIRVALSLILIVGFALF